MKFDSNNSTPTPLYIEFLISILHNGILTKKKQHINHLTNQATMKTWYPRTSVRNPTTEAVLIPPFYCSNVEEKKSKKKNYDILRHRIHTNQNKQSATGLASSCF